ncbi:MAG: hypothetical protein ACYDIA_24465 [Candidatus Humimicrobiaceae bacterium]
MPHPSKTKGDNGEREICKMFNGERTYWQPGEKTQGDVKMNLPYIGQAEVKRRKKTGFKQLYDWLEGNDALFIRSDYHKWLVVMPAEDLKLIVEENDELKRRLKR